MFGISEIGLFQPNRLPSEGCVLVISPDKKLNPEYANRLRNQGFKFLFEKVPVSGGGCTAYLLYFPPKHENNVEEAKPHLQAIFGDESSNFTKVAEEIFAHYNRSYEEIVNSWLPEVSI